MKMKAFVTLISGIVLFFSCSTKSSDTTGFSRHDLDSVPPGNPWIKIAADLDKDGKLDIIVGGQKGPLVWYKNPGWTKYVIADGGYDTVDGEAADMDKDGDQDLVLGGLVWYENPETLNSNPDQRWKMHRIAIHPTHDIEVADLNQDGLPDIITRDQSAFSNPDGNTIHLWYHQKDSIWQEDVIHCPHGEGIKCVDLDNDQDDDIVIGEIWYENTGGVEKVSWKDHKYCSWHSNASIEVIDINKDGRKDIFLAPAELAKQFYKIAWFEAPANDSTGNWTEHMVADSVECVIHSLRTADFNNDGLPDFVYGEMHQGADPDKVTVALNQNNGKYWEKLDVSDKGTHCLAVLDFDNDGDPDFFGANWSGQYQPLQLWENLLTSKK